MVEQHNSILLNVICNFALKTSSNFYPDTPPCYCINIKQFLRLHFISYSAYGVNIEQTNIEYRCTDVPLLQSQSSPKVQFTISRLFFLLFKHRSWFSLQLQFSSIYRSVVLLQFFFQQEYYFILLLFLRNIVNDTRLP